MTKFILAILKDLFKSAACLAVMLFPAWLAGLCESGSILLVPVLGAMVAFYCYWRYSVCR